MEHNVLSEVSRLENYSDALLAIIATLLVIPIVKLDEGTRLAIANSGITGVTLSSALTKGEFISNFVLFWGAFLLVVSLWMRHGRALRGITNFDQIGLALNSLQMLFIAVLPFTAGTASRSWADGSEEKSTRNGLAYLSINIFVISVLGLLLQIWGERHRHSHHKSWAMLALVEAVLEVGMSGLAWGLACVLDSGRYVAVFGVYLAFPLLVVAMRLVCVAVWGDSHAFSFRDLNAPQMRRSRVEAFTDGVLGIAATLIILDLQPPEACGAVRDAGMCVLLASKGCQLAWTAVLPTDKCPPDYPIPAASSSPTNFLCAKCYTTDQSSGVDLLTLLSFVIAFALVSFLWQQHNKLYEDLAAEERPFGVTEVFVNAHFCVFVSLLPFASNLVGLYAVRLPSTITNPDPSSNSLSSPSSHLSSLPLSSPSLFSPDPNAGLTACVFLLLMLLGACGALLTIRLPCTAADGASEHRVRAEAAAATHHGPPGTCGPRQHELETTAAMQPWSLHQTADAGLSPPLSSNNHICAPTLTTKLSPFIPGSPSGQDPVSVPPSSASASISLRLDEAESTNPTPSTPLFHSRTAASYCLPPRLLVLPAVIVLNLLLLAVFGAAVKLYPLCLVPLSFVGLYLRDLCCPSAARIAPVTNDDDDDDDARGSDYGCCRLPSATLPNDVTLQTPFLLK
eukprot:gnl/Spiro4/9975_TR5302_c0_g1_i1.p1 gnl/Spiro4/9975_TR5302_c0_g1~~gnl/Spiro4/9975_TR5302_c0_g1_i1.p1  ORF type:complete len:680 (+),score=183.12 gnl/Spiro4/9975_TR5302_c0_g1_i1:109-2148(+)